jgi:hypothetical protein
MVAEAELKLDVLEWLDSAFTESGDLSTAAIMVADRIVKEHLSDAFVREFGPEVLAFWWRKGNRNERDMAMRPGMRRVDVEAVRESPLEQLEKIGDRWVRVGDCNQEMCRELQRWYHRQGIGNLRKAYMFSKLADRLQGDKIVRETFSDDDLRNFLAEFRME